MTTLAAIAVLLAASGVAAAAPVQTYIEAPGPMGPLKGTMLSPAFAGAPVVLIIPGSGPTDRDGDNPMGVKGSIYRLLAEGLAARGVASVRIDKRGMFASAEAWANANNVTMADYAADTRAWIEAIRQKTGNRCVWVLGHSEGGLVALEASQNAADICGLILVSTPGRPLGAVLREQLKANPANAPLLEQAEGVIVSLEAGRHADVAGLHPALQRLFNPAVQDFLISEISLDPAKLIAAYRGPVLIVQGERDLQVAVQDAERLHGANPRARLALVPDANHVLKTVTSDERGANLATYADPSLPLARGIVEAIAEFVGSSGKPR